MLRRLDKSLVKAPEEIRAFCQHGFKYIPGNETGKQIFGKCPFCGHLEHKHEFTFYVNRETHKWDCKSCRREGGFKTFLEETVRLGKENFKRGAAIYLQDNRGLSIESLRKWDLGYNINNETYLLPIYDANHTELWNLYYWKAEVGMRGTHTMLPGIYGWFNFKKTGTIWLCEGEWDAIALQEVFDLLGKNDEVVVAVPSAGIFKQDWAALFCNRKVNVLYDNDEAGKGRFDMNAVGKGGMLLVQRLLTGVVEDIKYIHWPDTFENGFDIRDLYVKKSERQPGRTLKAIQSFLKPFPPEVAMPEGATVKEDDRLKKLDGEGLLPEQIYEGYEKYLFVKDRRVIDLMYGSIIANRWQGDPIWLFLVAPPGGSKSEFVMSISMAPLIYPLTSLTSKTLISGSKGAGGSDPSLIPLLDGRILLIKDATTILTQPKLDQEAIFGTLRDIYDGSIDFAFGNGLVKRYRSHFGILAAVTPAIELQDEADAILGARFLRYNMPHFTDVDEQTEIIKRAMSNTANEEEMRIALKELGKQVLNHNFTIQPEVPSGILEKIVYLAQWTAIMRGYVNRQKYTDYVTHKPFAEVGTRLAKQFQKLCMGIATFRREEIVTDYVYNDIITKVARSTAPSRCEAVVRFIYRNQGSHTRGEIANAIGLPGGTVELVLNNLVMLNALEKVLVAESKGMQYQLTNRLRNLIIRSEIYKNVKGYDID